MKNRRRYLLFLLLILIICLSGCGSYKYNPEQSSLKIPENTSGELIPLKIDEEYKRINADISSNASLSDYQDGKFLATDYSNLYVISLGDDVQVQIVNPPSGYTVYSGERSGPGIWNPTGVYYNKNTQMVYLANYNGHNILIGRITEDLNFEILRILTNEILVSPENVITNSDGSKIAVADYDGNKLMMFNQDGILEWDRDVKQAHGVAIDDEYVYVTGLEKRNIQKYTLEGRKVREKGKAGQYGPNKYLWPTSIYAYEDILLVSDAHQGRIIVLDKNLNYLTSFGGNGASEDTLHFPYSVICSNDILYIADTFNFRLAILDSTGTLLESYVSDDRKFSDQEGQMIEPYSVERYSYEVLEDIPAEFFNPYFEENSVVSSYASITLFKGNNVQRHIYLSSNPSGTGMPPNEQLYLTYVKKFQLNGNQYYLIGCPEKNYWYYIYDITNNVWFISNHQILDNCLWVIGNEFCFGGNLEDELKRIVEPAREFTLQFNSLIEAGVSRKNAYIKAFCGYYNHQFGLEMDESTFEKWIGQSFNTVAGREFWDKYEHTSNINELQDEYYKDSSKGRWDLCLDEVLYVKTFVDIPMG